MWSLVMMIICTLQFHADIVQIRVFLLQELLQIEAEKRQRESSEAAETIRLLQVQCTMQ